MDKKEQELFWLERAAGVRPDLFTGEPVPGESPDFVLVADGLRLGVEITRYSPHRVHGASIPEQQGSLQHQALQMARRSFQRRCSTSLRVQAVFSHDVFRQPTELRALADAISEYLASRIAVAPIWTRVEWTANDKIELPPQLFHPAATVMPSPEFVHWAPAGAGWVLNAGIAEIARITAIKEPHVTRYRQGCSALTLLIVFEGRPQLARAVHAPVEPIDFSVSTNFDHVLCLDVLEQRVIEVPVSGVP
jgi:hypothetical protein